MTSQTPAPTKSRTWSIRTAAAASVLTVALAAGAGAGLASLGGAAADRTGFPGGFAPQRGLLAPSTRPHPVPKGALPGNRFGPGQPPLPPVTRDDSTDGLDA